MCIWVEREHFKEFVRSAETKISDLKASVGGKTSDPLITLEPAIAEAAIIFRNFPKRHGNIIQKAVGSALSFHPGGYSKMSAKFTFLSDLTVEVDNFFMHSSGRIILFETKRDYGKVREDGIAGRNLRRV